MNKLKKVLISLFMLFSFLTVGCGVLAATSLIPLNESENYKGMSIIPEGTKNQSLIINMSLMYNNTNATNFYFNVSSEEIYVIILKSDYKSQNGVSNMLTIKNNRNLSYLINNYDSLVNANNFNIINDLNNFYSVKALNMNNNTIAIRENNNMFFQDINIYDNYKYIISILIYIPKVNENTNITFNNERYGNYPYQIAINYNWLYQYDGIYSYYNSNGFSMLKNVVNNNYGLTPLYKGVGISQGNNNILDLQPALTTFRYEENNFYSMYMLNYLYGYLTSSDNKSFNNNDSGYFDLYYFGNNGYYSLDKFQNDLYFYDSTNSSISNTYFNINFNWFIYSYTGIFQYNGNSDIILNNLLINDISSNYMNSYFKDNGDYYQQNVGETNNIDLVSDLGIHYINCDWWNLKGQLNNLIYYIITGLPFLNNLYALAINVFGIGKIGFNFFTWSIPLASLLGTILLIKILFDKMLK